MQLLEHFNELSLHPKNAKELKGLILQLAIQGNLTSRWREENSDVEPANILLESIELEKTKLIKETRTKKAKFLPKISSNEIPFSLPESWVWCRLGDVSSLINGDRGKNYPSKEHYVKTGIPFITARNLGDRFLKHGELNYITEEKFALLRSGQVESNDILYCLRGSLGKCAIVEGIDQGAIASSLCIVRPCVGLSSVFLLNYFLCPFGKEIILRHDNGTAQPNLSATDVKTFVFPLPPFKEQKAIVEVVNQLFAEVDQLETLTKERIQLKEDFASSALRQLSTGNTASEWVFLKEHFSTFFTEKSNIKKLRESILQLAVQGKLTANWRKTSPFGGGKGEDARQLLERIKAEKEQLVKEKKIKKEKPLPKISKEEIPYDLPDGWVWEYLGSSVLKITDGTHHSPTNIEKGKYKYVTAKNIKNYGIKLSNITYVTDEVHQEIYSRCNPEIGDILYIKDGATTGICCINNLEEEFSMLSSVALIKQSSDIVGDYLLSLFRSPYYYDLMRSGMTGVAITRVTLTKLKASIIPIPPLEEQKAIVEKVNALMALCDELEAAVEMSKATQEQWMASSLREVFAGEEEMSEL